MRPPDYFRFPDRVAALRAELETWMGTPFRKCSAVKGPQGGVDCAGLWAAALRNIGAIDREVFVPDYDRNYAEHSTESRLRAWFDQPDVKQRVRLLDREEPGLDGDFVFPIVGLTEHHLGGRIAGHVYHVIGQVTREPVGSRKYHPSRYRLMEAAS